MAVMAPWRVLGFEVQAGSLKEQRNWRLTGSWITSGYAIGRPRLKIQTYANELSVIFNKAKLMAAGRAPCQPVGASQ